jgi:hypothetical protein
MSIFQRKVPNDCVPIHQDNVSKNDWVVLLEAGTIVGRSAEKIRVAKATLEKTIVIKYNFLLRRSYYLILDGYDPRIHAVYLCPQLYRHDSTGNLVPMEGGEIGNLIAQSVADGVVAKPPWYNPSNKLEYPIISRARNNLAAVTCHDKKCNSGRPRH